MTPRRSALLALAAAAVVATPIREVGEWLRQAGCAEIAAPDTRPS